MKLINAAAIATLSAILTLGGGFAATAAVDEFPARTLTCQALPNSSAWSLQTAPVPPGSAQRIGGSLTPGTTVPCSPVIPGSGSYSFRAVETPAGVVGYLVEDVLIEKIVLDSAQMTLNGLVTQPVDTYGAGEPHVLALPEKQAEVLAVLQLGATLRMGSELIAGESSLAGAAQYRTVALEDGRTGYLRSTWITEVPSVDAGTFTNKLKPAHDVLIFQHPSTSSPVIGYAEARSAELKTAPPMGAFTPVLLESGATGYLWGPQIGGIVPSTSDEEATAEWARVEALLAAEKAAASTPSTEAPKETPGVVEKPRSLSNDRRHVHR